MRADAGMLAIVNFTLINILEIFFGDAVTFLGNSSIILDLPRYDLLGRLEAMLSLELINPYYRSKAFLRTLPSAHEIRGLAGMSGVIPGPVRVSDNVLFCPFG